MDDLALFPPLTDPPRPAARLDRRAWHVGPTVTRPEADLFLDARHYLGRSGPPTLLHALRPREGVWLGSVAGVALWVPANLAAARWACPTNPHGVLVLSRLCVIPWVPANGAKLLLSAGSRLIDRRRWPVLLSYADPAAGHTGAIYKAAGWQDAGLRPGTDAWQSPTGQVVTRPREPGTRRPLRAAELRAAGWERVRGTEKRAYLLRPRTRT